MTQVILTFYDENYRAVNVLGELLQAGFERSQLEYFRVHPDRADRILRRRSPTEEEKVIGLEETKELMIEREVEPREAEQSLLRVREGEYLVMVRSGDELSGRAKEILNQYPFEAQEDQTTYDDGR